MKKREEDNRVSEELKRKSGRDRRSDNEREGESKEGRQR